MERPEIIDQYYAAAKSKSEAEKIVKELKPEVLETLKECDGWDDIYLTPTRSIEYNEDLVYDWIKSDYPNLCLALTKETLDWERFEQALHLQEIDIKRMPKHCLIETKGFNINTARRRKIKNEN